MKSSNARSHTTDTSLTRPGVAPTDMTLIVTCLLGTQQYGLPIDAVREVVRLPALLSLAGAPPYFCGLVNLRGNYMPVLDGRMLVEEPPWYDLTRQIIVIGYQRPEMGLLVDHVLDVCALQRAQWTPIAQHAAAAFLQGVVSTGPTSAIIFDVAVLLALVQGVRAS